MSMIRLGLVLTPLLLAACAGTPPRFPAEEINTAVTPQQVAARDQASQRGQKVLWGGVIVNSSNLENATQVEVLAYPLTDRQRPNLDKQPIGRFLAVKPGYLETADFAPGRQVTIQGTLDEAAVGKVGQADYTFPVVTIVDSELWKPETSVQYDSRPRFNFGIGVMIGH